MLSDPELIRYYSLRAREYDRLYEKPERQADLRRLRADLAQRLAGHDVLEVACGTGYWTEAVAGSVRSLTATDASPEVIDVARSRAYPAGRVRFAVSGVASLASLPASERERPFTAGLAGFLWSHIERGALRRFVESFHRALAPGALVVILDNRFVAGSSTPIARTDAAGNTYQQRRLEDGGVHEVLKNFPDEAEVRAVLAGTASDVEYLALPYFWRVAYRAA